MKLYLYIYQKSKTIEYVKKVDKLESAPPWMGGYSLIESANSSNYMSALNEPSVGFVNWFLSFKELSERDKGKVEMELVRRFKERGEIDEGI